MSKTAWIIIVVVGIILVCCCCAAIGAFGYLVSQRDTTDIIPTLMPFPIPTQINQYPNPTPVIEVPLPTPVPNATAVPAPEGALNTLRTLQESIVPNNDPRGLAERLKGIPDIPLTVEPAPAYDVGDSSEFWVTNVDTNDNFKITATLQYETDHVYFWIENGVNYKKNELKNLVEAFETKIYPTDREFFGSEWTPGVDGDPHLYIVYATNLGGNLAGYFSSADELHPLAHQYSNGHETFMMNADTTGLGEDFTYGVLAHEFQHMIHWYTDRNEESWLNEGFSELATLLNDYDPGGFDYAFLMDPDLQLNDWPNDSDATTPHYGAGFLFTTYLLDRFGEDVTKAIVADPDNGFDSIENVLAKENITDALTGKAVGADDVFADWVVANYLGDADVADGRFVYKSYSPSQASDTETIYDCSSDWTSRSVSQYGTDYINLACDGNYTLEFQGDTTVGVLEPNAYSGTYAFWSNKGDESDMTLTQEFDFSGVTAPIQITYRTWYDLEEDYDFAYLAASTDGKSWQILNTPSCTTNNVSGNSYGCGYNASTNGWIEESVDLNQFAGKKVQLRFEYVTDAAVNGEGLLLDDVAIPAINYFSDFEQDNGGWQPAGFVRIENALPQTYRISIIKQGASTTVENLTLDAGQSGSIPLTIGSGVDSVTLVVSGTTRFTRQKAQYQFRLVK